MKPQSQSTSVTLRVFLVLSGALASAIGAAILFVPHVFHAANGIELAADPNLMSEVRAPGALLLVAGLAIFAGALVARWSRSATVIASVLFLAYGSARLVSVALDGAPGAGLLVATVLELVLGAIAAIVSLRVTPRSEKAVGRSRSAKRVEIA